MLEEESVRSDAIFPHSSSFLNHLFAKKPLMTKLFSASCFVHFVLWVVRIGKFQTANRLDGETDCQAVR
jgi:hypothetical protein